MLVMVNYMTIIIEYNMYSKFINNLFNNTINTTTLLTCIIFLLL